MTRASVDSRLRFGFSTLGVWVLLPAMGLAWSAFGASVVVLTAFGQDARPRGLTVSAFSAVSLEPPGGSPTGAPTGPVIASGKLTSL